MQVGVHDIGRALAGFGLPEAGSFRVLADTQETRGGLPAVRIVVRVKLTDGREVILRFLNERNFIMDIRRLRMSTRTLERQSEFSALLGENGLIVPEKYRANGRYCLPYEIDGIPLDVTAEAFLGDPPPRFSPELFAAFGALTGRIHRVSLENRFRVGFSILYDEQAKGRTSYRGIFGGRDLTPLDADALRAVEARHDALSARVCAVWPKLPFSAVHGDIYSCNNIAVTPRGLGFYDFNIASDEVLLGDFFHVWFRTLYDAGNVEARRHWDVAACFRQYEAAYARERPFEQEELEAFEDVRALMACIFRSRGVALLLDAGRHAEARTELTELARDMERARL